MPDPIFNRHPHTHRAMSQRTKSTNIFEKLEMILNILSCFVWRFFFCSFYFQGECARRSGQKWKYYICIGSHSVNQSQQAERHTEWEKKTLSHAEANFWYVCFAKFPWWLNACACVLAYVLASVRQQGRYTIKSTEKKNTHAHFILYTRIKAAVEICIAYMCRASNCRMLIFTPRK